MNILIVEPFYTGSHKTWAEEYKKHSTCNIDLLTLPGLNWKWRMHGGAISLGKKFLESDLKPDMILASDMLDLALFQSITKKRTSKIPAAVYFHENQFTYPWSPNDKSAQKGLDLHYGFINYSSAYTADKVFFNSEFHRHEFLSATRDFLKKFRDFQELSSVEEIEKKSEILAVGINFAELDKFKVQGLDLKEKVSTSSPILLWNHRWEHDKNPEGFLTLLDNLIKKNFDFRLVVLGEQPGNKAKQIESYKEKLGERILHWGYAESRADYISWLWASDIIPVTSYHDFFGISVVEAVYCNTLPLLPERLAYPEVFSDKVFKDCFYKSENDLFSLVQEHKSIDFDQSTKHLEQYNWKTLAPIYDSNFKAL